MRTKNNRLAYMLAFGTTFVAMSYANAAFAAPVTGKASVQLTNVFATLGTGARDPNPEHTAACRKQLSLPTSRYLGVTVTTQYSVDAQSLIMSASSMLRSPHVIKPVQLTIKLSPLGIANQYAFGAFRPTALPDNYVLFSMGTDFKGAKSSILVLNSGMDYNCVASSDPAPFNGGVSTKFGSDQK